MSAGDAVGSDSAATGGRAGGEHAGHPRRVCVYGVSTVVLIGFTCPAITAATIILRALDRVRGRALGWLGPWRVRGIGGKSSEV